MRNIAKIIVEQGFVIYIGKSSQSEFHKHHAIQIGLALQGKYLLYIDNKTYNDGNFIINSNVSHKHESKDGILICILIDPETDLGHLLTTNYPNRYHPFTPLPNVLSQLYEEIVKDDFSILNLQHLIIKLFDLEPITRTTDVRIDSFIQKMASSNMAKVELESLMHDIPLSASRIRHLFKMQTGISIQRYVLWSKVKNAIQYIMQEESLSQAAYLSGFSDYAHMSRTIKQMFGLNLKTILKDSHYVQDL